MKRFVVLRIDDIYRMLADYAGESLGLTNTTKVAKFRIQQGKLQLILEDEAWDGEQPAEEVRFDIKRVFSV